jgi:glycosyltransferase involved in cell wall biosynthesis
MKVTFCAYDRPDFGGPNSWLRRLLPSLVEAGLEINVLFFVQNYPEDCPAYQDLKNQGITCKIFPLAATTGRKIYNILNYLSSSPPDIFVPNLVVPAYYASRWIKQSGIPTIGVLHSDDNFYRGLLRQFVFGESAYQLSALVCVSDFLLEYVKAQVSGHHSTLIRKIPYGVPIPAQFALPATDYLKLIYVGRLVEEQKRISDVTTALCRVLQEVPKTQAIIYGDGSARSNVEKIIDEKGRNLPIELKGFINNARIQELMLEAHILVLLSDYEGLPISLMEAMACGLVPICLDIRSGIPELVDRGVTGLLVNDRSDEFVNAVKQLREYHNLWTEISCNARQKIIASYSTEVCTAKWIELFNELHRHSPKKSKLNIPRFLRLPDIDPDLAREDFRLRTKIIRKLKNMINKVRRFSGAGQTC